ECSLTCQSKRGQFDLAQQGKLNSAANTFKRKATAEDTSQLEKARSRSQKPSRVSRIEPEPEHPHQQQYPEQTWYDPLAEFDPFATESEGSDDDDNGSDDYDNDEVEGDMMAVEENQDGQAEENEGFKACKKSSKQFKKYVRNAFQNYAHLDENEEAAIKIMRTLLKKKAPLDTYEAVMEWHLNTCGKLRPGASLGKSECFVSRQKLMDKLRKRYNMEHKYATPKHIVLPHTKTKVTVWWKNARDNVQSLLTDPRWKDEDFLYFDNDPFAPPPDDLDYISDINTGEAYIETYRRLITKPNQILVGIPLYIDGAVTGQFDKLQITSLKMTLGILNRKARDRQHAWRSLGFVTNYAKEDSRGCVRA
ncbi:MAG: hypothetical protein LC650_03515, partial [Actinobacteria bacterium]|nr:hypothetical protein [Actinomycetota bacterium]